MKKFIVILALLAVACTPAMAAVTVSCAQVGTTKDCDVSYSTDANSVRAFALDISVNSGTVTAVSCSSTAYYVYPGSIQISGQSVSNYGDCVCVAGKGGALGGRGTTGVTVEMGSLYTGTNKPNNSGGLIRLTVSTLPATVTIASNSARGGVVMERPEEVPTVTLSTCVLVSGPSCDTVPNVVGMTRANAKAAIIAAGYVVATPDVNVPGTGAQAVGTVTASNPAAGATPGCGSGITLSVVSQCVKPSNIMYANWLNRGKPDCWCYPRQCRGDADGKKAGTLWVSNNDLIILKSSISKAEASIPPGGICADFDHKKAGTLWVSNNDLIILKRYISKAEASIPMCSNPAPADPNYNFWCIPTGVACPAGQTCAPAGTCPK